MSKLVQIGSIVSMCCMFTFQTLFSLHFFHHDLSSSHHHKRSLVEGDIVSKYDSGCDFCNLFSESLYTFEVLAIPPNTIRIASSNSWVEENRLNSLVTQIFLRGPPANHVLREITYLKISQINTLRYF